jgi:hypothetical protein
VTCPSGAIKFFNCETTLEVEQEKMAEFSLGLSKAKSTRWLHQFPDHIKSAL